jgi:activator of Hsp90 ATPase-like protein
MAAHTCELEIEASVDSVFELLTTADGVSRWWRTPIDHDLVATACAELPLSGDASLRIRVDRLERPWLVLWTCIGGVPEWERSTLRFDVEDLGPTTLLRLTHRDWQWRDPRGQLWSLDFSWSRQLLQLRDLALERGRAVQCRHVA